MVIKAKTFLPSGKSSKTRTGTFHKEILRKPVDVKDVKPGLEIKIFDGKISTLDKFDSELINHGEIETLVIPDLLNDSKNNRDYYGLELWLY